jgi:hypothetical protein
MKGTASGCSYLSRIRDGVPGKASGHDLGLWAVMAPTASSTLATRSPAVPQSPLRLSDLSVADDVSFSRS